MHSSICKGCICNTTTDMNLSCTMINTGLNFPKWWQDEEQESRCNSTYLCIPKYKKYDLKISATIIHISIYHKSDYKSYHFILSYFIYITLFYSFHIPYVSYMISYSSSYHTYHQYLIYHVKNIIIN